MCLEHRFLSLQILIASLVLGVCSKMLSELIGNAFNSNQMIIIFGESFRL